MGFYLIYPDGKSDFQLDPKNLAKHLASHWENFEIVNVNVPGDTSQLSWTCNVQGVPIFGDLLASRDTIAVDDGAGEQALDEFVVWYRTLIPTHIRPFLSHDSWGAEEIEITKHISADEILRQLNEID